jgi:hypothetical protein
MQLSKKVEKLFQLLFEKTAMTATRGNPIKEILPEKI